MSGVRIDSRSSLAFLDGLRGLAALYVVVGHARWLLWEGFASFQQHPASYSPIQKYLVYALSLFRYGHESVLFFFVLSGFVIHLRYARKLATDGRNAKFDWLPFLWRRAQRLYPPLLAALVLSGILYAVGHAAGYAIYRSATTYPVINANVVWNLSGTTLLGNLAFLMETYVPVFGGNGPLWSLKFEWWFYMLYPLFWLMSRRSLWLATVVMTLLFAASYLPGWPVRLLQTIFSEMLCWWLGVLLADIYATRLKIHWGLVSAIGLGGAAGTIFLPTAHDLSMAFFFSALLALCFLADSRGVKLTALKALKPLGDMSYTLYVTHFPMLVLASGWLMSRSPERLLPAHLNWVLISILLIIILAYGVHRAAERPFLHRQTAS